MNRSIIVGLALALGASAGSGLASGTAFDANYAKARKNVAEPKGAAYDKKLGLALQSNADFQKQFKECAKRHPGKQVAHGYLSFGSPTSYKVVLQPRNEFAGCLTHALEGHHVPPPPSLPYLNPFELSASPPSKGVQPRG